MSNDAVVTLERESDSDARASIAMDTPKRKQINTPLSKFEDSPVFNYLNNLSPIQPVKSISITQTFDSLSFASPPSGFTSPHVSSVKESRFLRRHQSSDTSKPEFSSENVNKVDKHENVLGISHNSNEQGFVPGSSCPESPYASSLANELSRTLNYGSDNRDSDPSACVVVKTKCTPELTGSSTTFVPSVHIDAGDFQVENELNSEGISEIYKNKEVSWSDWENLLSDEADLSILKSPNGSKSLKDSSPESLEPGKSFFTSLPDDLQNSGATQVVGRCEHETNNTFFQHTERSNMNELDEEQDNLVSVSNCEAGGTNEIMDHELASNMLRGLRRRCLVFESAGSRRKHLDDVSDIGPSMLSHSYDNISFGDKCVVRNMPENETSRCVLPGIRLNLNALASTSVNNKAVKHEALDTGGQTIPLFQADASLDSSDKLQISNNLVVSSSERDMLPVGVNISNVEDVAQASECAVDETHNHSSSNKNRHMMESGGESEACKHCNCKKSKCLKLYCECFAAGVYCVEPCSCQECFNNPIHKDTVLSTRRQIESRNPLAFAPKVMVSAESMEVGEESSKTPASARHKRGCNCKKSGCTKKYCECYQGGVGCFINCRCEGCKNAFGRKDGSIGIEFELGGEHENNTCRRSVVNRSLKITTFENDAEENTKFAPPVTPLQFGRQLTELSLSSKKRRPPRSSFLAVGSSSGIYGSQKLRKLNPPHGELEKNTQLVQEDEMPDIVQSPISAVKSTSPNSKRVSPPHCNIGLGKRSSRKLILQSIPCFPSLTPKR